MSVSSVGSSGLNSSLYSSFVDNPNSALGKSDFLQLLVTKLKFQDPLKPLADESFVADLAQFSSLEQMSNMNANSQSQSDAINSLNQNLIGLMLMQNTTQAAGLIGKTVVVKTADADGNEQQIEGQVDVVRFVDGQPKIVVNGVEYGLSVIQEIKA